MRFRRPIIGLLIVLLSVMALGPLSATTASAAPPAAPGGSTYRAVPISGTLDNGNLFVGTLNLQNFAAQNGNLVANGTVSGFITDATGNILNTVNPTAATLPVQATGTCAILHLTLGPLDLNLLGLTVHLNQVVLNIDAQSGPGNLLGNLLCAVAHLLDGPGNPLAAIVNLLNRILDQLFPSIPIAGPAAGGGIFAGALTLQNVATQGNGLVANGLVSGTLVNANGAQPASSQAAVPLQVTGTCAILHLTLGPLDLNLLGLTVHLNQVVLNIDAQSGPGNLLGNLLCAVAHLLDQGGPLSQIAALLNQILSFL